MTTYAHIIKTGETPWQHRSNAGEIEMDRCDDMTAEQVIAALADLGIVVEDYWDRRAQGAGFWATEQCQHEHTTDGECDDCDAKVTL